MSIQEMVDQANAKIINTSLTAAGVELGITAIINAINAIGIMQYPIILIDWKIGLTITRITLCFPAIYNLCLRRLLPARKSEKHSRSYRRYTAS
jgi:hypothetical protein